MIRDIFEKYKIYKYAFVSGDILAPANRRLYGALPSGCMAVFVLFPYYVGADPFPLSRFAAVPDYHFFADKVFGEVCDYVSMKYPESYVRGFADHSPFAERDGAAAAGLGIVGKNGLLINRDYSSFVCIGEIVTTLGKEELIKEGIPEGGGAVSFCENCGACAAACPGECAGTYSRETCASYINQKKGELSDIEVGVMKKSGYIWGCDVCQNVCPHTRDAIRRGTIETPIEFFKNGLIVGDIESEIISLSDEEYKKYPFSWRKRDIMMRNIEVMKNK